ncbi:hypothetical protein IOD16_31005 [Saccharothrix sp. 6-C]|uniref:hypothetical protein n=1 Tax=Saccharothrix sp. 6-C TaxID=2781735 RepID=UPI0019175509|nr:hypothetical protein [Saccharothrix sp. 6-C]QQQ75482.1 hypothetical protein IOD16_31005 [Saccharothrix sp. 6-C]
MKRWTQLTDHQLAVLQRVGDPDDQVTARDSALATTVYALRNRGLVVTPRVDGRWRAEITVAGRFYLEHGYHPERPDVPGQAGTLSRRRSPRPASEKKRSARQITVETLLQLLEEQDGSVRVEDPDSETRAAWRRAIAAVKRQNLVPAGMHLRHHGRDEGDLVIELVQGEHPDAKYWEPRPQLAAPEADPPHPAVAKLSRDPAPLRVSKDSRERALRLLHILATEWERSGHAVAVEADQPGLTFTSGTSRFVLEVSEESDLVEAPHLEELERKPTYSWQRVPVRSRYVSSGRLVLELPHSWDYNGRRRRWADRTRWSLEDKLGDVLKELEGRVRLDEERRIAAEREKAARRVQWEEAMAEARFRFAEDVRIAALNEQMQAWETAAKVRAYCQAAEAALVESPDSDVVEWLRWMRNYADRIDPAVCGVQAPQLREPSAHELRPYLDRWSPYGPDSSY